MLETSKKITMLLSQAHIASGLKSAHVKGLASQLEGFAQADADSTLNSVAAGRVYAHILGLTLDEQKEVVTALAKEMGCAAPSYPEGGQGRPTQGRNQLASVVYHAHPKMLRKQGKNKDSLAGKSISRCLRAYKNSLGGAALHRNKRTSGSRGTHLVSRRVFETLYTAAASKAEHELLIELLARAGMAEKELVEWASKVQEAQTAAQSPASQVTPAEEGKAPAGPTLAAAA